MLRARSNRYGSFCKTSSLAQTASYRYFVQQEYAAKPSVLHAACSTLRLYRQTCTLGSSHNIRVSSYTWHIPYALLCPPHQAYAPPLQLRLFSHSLFVTSFLLPAAPSRPSSSIVPAAEYSSTASKTSIDIQIKTFAPLR